MSEPAQSAQVTPEAPKQEAPAAPATPAQTPAPVQGAADPKTAEPPKEQTPPAPDAAELKLPEGSKLDAKVIESVSAYAKEHGLTQAQAQALLNREDAAQKANAEASVQAFNKQADEWEAQIKADPQIGGANLTQSLALANRAIDTYASPEFAKELRESRIGSHPGLVRLLVAAGKAIADDSAVLPGASAPTGQPLRHADVLYPSLANTKNE